jgi:hypothetical protein
MLNLKYNIWNIKEYNADKARYQRPAPKRRAIQKKCYWEQQHEDSTTHVDLQKNAKEEQCKC